MTWLCGASRSLDTVDDESWDGAAAKAAIFRWAGEDSDGNVNSSKARKGFLVYDDENDGQHGGYKLPFAVVRDGSLKASLAGCRAAASRLPQTDGPSAEVKKKARSVLDHYLGEQNGQNMTDQIPGSERTIYRSTIPIQLRKLGASDRDSLMALVAERAPDPSVFEGEDAPQPFFFTTRASNNKLDSYYTWMADSSLRNYAEDATDPGVQFQVSHNGGGSLFGGGGEVGFGRSLQGKVVGSQRDRSCLIDFYTVPGLQCGNMTSDQFIAGARSGIYADVSIGFMPGAMICGVCENDFLRKYEFDWDDPQRCPHWPGMTYDVEKGRKTEKVVCTLRVEDAHLNEVSTVYDGATPGAGIVAVDSARIASSLGKLTDPERQVLENLYRVRIEPPTRVYALGEVPVSGRTKQHDDTETTVASADTTEEPQATNERAAGVVSQNPSGDDETVILETTEERSDNTDESDPMASLRTKYAGTIVKLGGRDPYRSIDILAQKVVDQHAQIGKLQREAEDGRQFRETLLADLDAAVVRALGSENAETNQARYRRMADGLDAEGVRELTNDLEQRATKRFQAGRQTRETDEGDEEDTDRPANRQDRRERTPARLVGI